ncbi:cell division protein ZapA [Paenalcaligenes hominis]|uniref:Cell division protein ZapA n=1 Tax=Paenalcaligenes hominis TaxID=643674 RepID=A0A1U9JZM0_9BURK|nr:cell division protein ZapA [Paenalcaligenes hominis]AQS51240.1 cell division protein ZapA [Paenalcaligenes hominis]NJB66354.1 cell division protein ZapA [Paenalcaligenes hominis]GGE76113.1 cell division protein ZapA [Paenalcaligenes hominis]
MERLDINLLGRDYTLACPPSEKAKLLEAVQHVDQHMERIKDAGRTSGNERIAVMAAIQIAVELLSMKAPNGPLGDLALGDFKRKIDDMHRLMDGVLGTNDQNR